MLLSNFLLLEVYDNHALLVVSTCVVQNNGPSLHLQKACNDLQVFFGLSSRLNMHYISCKYVTHACRIAIWKFFWYAVSCVHFDVVPHLIQKKRHIEMLL